MTSFHDKALIGVWHDKENKTLTLYFEDERLIYNNVVFFQINHFSEQNIILDLFYFSNKDIPEDLLQNFPFLQPFTRTDEHYEICHISSSVGSEGVVIFQ